MWNLLRCVPTVLTVQGYLLFCLSLKSIVKDFVRVLFNQLSQPLFALTLSFFDSLPFCCQILEHQSSICVQSFQVSLNSKAEKTYRSRLRRRGCLLLQVSCCLILLLAGVHSRGFHSELLSLKLTIANHQNNSFENRTTKESKTN